MLETFFACRCLYIECASSSRHLTAEQRTPQLALVLDCDGHKKTDYSDAPPTDCFDQGFTNQKFVIPLFVAMGILSWIDNPYIHDKLTHTTETDPGHCLALA